MSRDTMYVFRALLIEAVLGLGPCFHHEPRRQLIMLYLVFTPGALHSLRVVILGDLFVFVDSSVPSRTHLGL